MVTSKTSSKYTSKTKGTKSLVKSFKRQAQLLDAQADARERGRQNLDLQLANANLRNLNTRRSVVRDLLSGDRTARLGYDRSEEDATGNLGTGVASSILNRAREGMNAISELSNMQAGETDRIKGMAASIRAMKANLDGVANDFGSAITSINNSLGDLNTSTSTNIGNALREQNTSDAQAFAEYLAGNQQAYADIVDLRGQEAAAREQMADTLATKISKIKSSETSSTSTSGTSTSVTGSSNQVDSLKHNKLSRKQVRQSKGAIGASVDAANRLADTMGRTFTDPILTIDDMNAQETDPNMRWTAAAMKENRSNLDELANAGTLRKMRAPEGSRLRKRVLA